MVHMLTVPVYMLTVPVHMLTPLMSSKFILPNKDHDSASLSFFPRNGYNE